jgi:cell division cycle 14
MIKNFGFSGHEAIAWIRLCRPGSIIGPQQKYLLSYAAEIGRGGRADLSSGRAQPKPTVVVPPPMPKGHVGGKYTETPGGPPHRRIPPKTPNPTKDARSPNIRAAPAPLPTEDSLALQGVGFTPYYPQPRKYRMAGRPTTASPKR